MIDQKNLFPYLEKNKDSEVEVMLHPSVGFSAQDQNDLDERFISFFKSAYRKQEYELCFNSKFQKYVG